MKNGLQRSSQIYGALQTALLCGFAVAFFFDLGPWLLAPERSRPFSNVLCAVGILMMLLAFISLRKVIQIAPAPREDGYLVTSGVYRWLRHPIYTAIVILVIGLFLRKPTAIVAAATVLVILFLVVKARFEERLLAERYPDYVAYKTETFGVIPGFG